MIAFMLQFTIVLSPPLCDAALSESSIKDIIFLPDS